MKRIKDIEIVTDRYKGQEYGYGVSIALTVYNESPYMIERCFEGLNIQTFENIELIIVNDGVDNDWVESSVFNAMKNLGDKFMRVVYHRNDENMGAAYAKNYALKLCTQKYVMQFDADMQIIYDGYVKECAEFLENNTDYFGVCGPVVYQYDPSQTSFTVGTIDHLEDLSNICKQWAPPIYIMMPRACFGDVEYRDCIQFDGDFWINIFYHNRDKKFKNIDYWYYGVIFHDLGIVAPVVDNRKKLDVNDPYKPKMTQEVSDRFKEIGIEYGMFGGTRHDYMRLLAGNEKIYKYFVDGQ